MPREIPADPGETFHLFSFTTEAVSVFTLVKLRMELCGWWDCFACVEAFVVFVCSISMNYLDYLNFVFCNACICLHWATFQGITREMYALKCVSVSEYNNTRTDNHHLF